MEQSAAVRASVFGSSSLGDVDRIEAVLGIANLAWWEMDCETGAVRFHPRKAEMLGYPSERFHHYTDFTSLLHPDDQARAVGAMRKHLEGVEPDYHVDYRIRCADGSYLWLEDVGRVTARDGDRPLVVTGVARDISARKRIEEELRQGQERLEALFHGHSAIKLVIDPETGQILDANQAAAAYYGWPIEELRRKRIQEINTMPPDGVVREMARASSSPNASFEFLHRRADGSVRDVEVFSNRIDVGGRRLLYSIIHDITDRKRAETALRESEKSLSHAEDFAHFGHWEVSLVDRIVHASAGAVRIYGESRRDLPLSAVQQYVFPDDRPRLDAALRALVDRGEPYDMEFRIHRADDGAEVVVHSWAEYDPVRRTVFGVLQDITERKRVQVERENLILELQSALEHIRTLKGIVPICASCKKIRDDRGYWEQVEAYLSRHTDVRFSHGICPECMAKHYPGV